MSKDVVDFFKYLSFKILQLRILWVLLLILSVTDLFLDFRVPLLSLILRVMVIEYDKRADPEALKILLILA